MKIHWRAINKETPFWLAGMSAETVRSITISGYLMTSPIYVSWWDLEETDSLLLFEPWQLCSVAISHETVQNCSRQADTHNKQRIYGDGGYETEKFRCRVKVPVTKISIEE